MAYKFQLGAARLAGTTTFKDGLDNNEQNIQNVGDIALDSISADNAADGVVISMPHNVASGLEILSGSETYMQFKTNSQRIDVDQNMRIDGSKQLEFNSSSDKIELDTDLKLSSGADILMVPAGGDVKVTGDLSASLNLEGQNLKVALGGDIGPRAAGAMSIGGGMGSNTLTIGQSATSVVIAGSLTVQGAATEIQQGFVVTSSVQFEGITPDGNELTLTTANPTADRTVTLPDLTGHVPVLNSAVANSNVSGSEFALLSGLSSVGTTALADADGFMHNDNGTMKQTQVLKIAELAFSKVSGDAIIASGGALTIAADAVEGTMLDANVADDTTLELISNQLRIKAAGVAGSHLNDDCISGQADFGSTPSDILDADEFLISNGGVLNRIDASVLRAYFQTGVVADTAGKLKRAVSEYVGDADAHQALSTGGIDFFNITASATALVTGSFNVGDMLTVKGGANISNAVTITVSASHGNNTELLYTFDGQTTIELESSFAAVDLVYVSGSTGTDWIIL